MTWVYTTRSAIAAALLAAVPASAAAPSSMSPPRAMASADSLRGRVTTEHGEPVSGAAVAIFAPGDTQTVVQTRTSATGTYTIVVPAGDMYLLRVRAIGYRPVQFVLRRARPTPPAGGAWRAPDTIRMRALAVATGGSDTEHVRRSAPR